jgi:hypothetical protein
MRPGVVRWYHSPFMEAMAMPSQVTLWVSGAETLCSSNERERREGEGEEGGGGTGRRLFPRNFSG